MKKLNNNLFTALSLVLLSTVFSEEGLSQQYDGFKARGGDITCDGITADDADTAKACVAKLIKSNPNLDIVYEFVQNHNSGKHLSEMSTCKDDKKLRGSFFPQKKTDFRAVFEGASVKSCTYNAQHLSYNCLVSVGGETCKALAANGDGTFQGGEPGKYDILFSVDPTTGDVRSVFPGGNI
ncbi:MAG: hypothetical protein IBJ00_01605 [Alphaproteobacteria bacterium]|nr:hypothetical protein [Alphaproteobacteria bacterium]